MLLSTDMALAHRQRVQISETITVAPITISSNAGQSKVYGSNDPSSAETAYSLSSGTLYGSNSLTGDMGLLRES